MTKRRRAERTIGAESYPAARPRIIGDLLDSKEADAAGSSLIHTRLQAGVLQRLATTELAEEMSIAGQLRLSLIIHLGESQPMLDIPPKRPYSVRDN
jgi:hypothetical protein